MDYYERKLKAQRMIAMLRNKNVSRKKIYLMVTNEFGMSRKFIDDYIEMIEDDD